MLVNGIPWQVIVGIVFENILVLVFIAIGCTVLSIFGWWPWFAVSLFIVMLIIITRLIPIILNLSRSFWFFTFLVMLICVGVEILSFAFYFRNWGLTLVSTNTISYSFIDSLYFSIVTWTNQGSSEFILPSAFRLYASFEGIFGIVHIALLTAFLWLWCQENMVEKGKAFMDRDMFNLKIGTRERIRIWTIKGEEKKLEDYVSLDKLLGKALKFDPQKGSWEIVETDTPLKDGTEVIVHERVCKKTIKNHKTT